MTLEYEFRADDTGTLLFKMPKVDRDFREGDIFIVDSVTYKVESAIPEFVSHSGLIPPGGYDQPVCTVRVSVVP